MCPISIYRTLACNKGKTCRFGSEAGAEVDAVSAYQNQTALSEAVRYNATELVCILVTGGANVDRCTIGEFEHTEDSADLVMEHSAIEY